MTYSFKIVEEKHTLGNADLELLVWSSRRDLIVVSNTSGISALFLDLELLI